MSSPFPSHPTSSPFSFPQFTHPSPLPTQSQVGGAGPIFAPSPLSQLISSAIPSFLHGGGGGGGGGQIAAANAGVGVGTTGTGTGTGVSPNYPFGAGGGITPNTSALIAATMSAAVAGGLTPSGNQVQGSQAGGHINGGGGIGNGNGNGVEGGHDLITGLQDADTMLERLEHVLGEVKDLEGRVFDGAQDGDLARIESLHTEYTQLLISLITLSQTHLFGALPTLNSPTIPTTTSVEPSEPSASPPTPTPPPTLSNLTRWAEERASLEFTRREGLKAGSKAVLDVLRARATSSR